jgi:uncharacterized membrane protein
VTPAYPQIAGQSVSRLEAISDGIFAVAMTLLVLDLAIKGTHPGHGEHPLWTPGAFASERAAWSELAGLAHKVLPYVMSFITLGIFWVGQQTQLNHFERANRALTWIHLAFLAGVTLMPFSTRFLSAYLSYRTPFLVYWLNLLLLGSLLYASMAYAGRAGLFKAEATAEIRMALRRRIYVYQACYLVALGLSVVNTYVSLGVFVALQLLAIISPPVPPFNRV